MASRFPWTQNFSGSSYINRALAPIAPAKSYLAAIGAAYLAVKGFQTIACLSRGLYSYVLAGPLNLGVDLKKVGDWAVITGSSDGIGKEYAHQLAAKGLNVVLIARNQEKTEQVAQEIRSIHKVFAKVIILDLAQMTAKDATELEEQLRPLRIAILINNAGVYPEQERFLACPPENDKAEEVVHLNITAVVLVTRAILPLLVSQGKGYIMNISSILGEKPVIGASLYSASKTFVDYFSQALDYEYRSRGIRVQSVVTGLVRTKMLSKEAKKMPFAVDAKDFAVSSLALIGVRQRHHGHWKHALMSRIGSVLPTYNLLKQ